MTLEDFKDLTASVQSLSIGFAAILGGVWALFRFWTLRESSRAAVELRAKERELRSRSLLNLTIKAEVTADIEGIGRCILISITVSNPGNHAEIIRWQQTRLEVVPILRGRNGTLIFGEGVPTLIHRNPAISSAIEPGEIQSYAFTTAAQPGLYRVEFLCAVSVGRSDVEASHKSAGVPIGDLMYSVATHVEVPSKGAV